ncbi:GPI transamidase component PIG-S isoform X2 [Zeugodacus cucurbitae]|uniref:GPI transamidase component PIG-S isoform X2 n=1 Tax=Zeugodacus cucurbitae TaxID=28588 RepID=UPI00059698D6|nr:GPI transamidase component PIG-S isoform X2 [Zeugodacus cucurbitae]
MEKSKAKVTTEDIADGEDKYRLFASMAFMIVVIIVGVPMWWKTTEVYRVNLPSADILSLSDKPIEIATKIAIFTFEKSRGELLVKELTEAYANNELWHPQFVQIAPFEQSLHTKTPASLENILLKAEEIKAGDFIFIEWPKLQEEVLLTAERSALIRSDTSSTRIKQVINLLLLQTHRIQQILNENHRQAVKSEAPQTEYDVVVSILNPRPDIMNAKWNVRMAVETYIAPFLKEVSQISNYTLTTQWKYQLPFEADLKQVRDSSKIGRHYALGEADLPHIITSIEKNLGVGITAKPAINLVVYITPCDIAPVHIYNRQNRQATRQKVDSFISPKWGGIIIANPPIEACLSYNTAQQPVEFYVNTNDVMQIMLYQLQKLLDINAEFNLEGVKTVALEQTAPRRWEYEAYIRRSVVMHIATASNTLQSLIKLLDNISYIVINDDVGESINDAYKKLLLAKQALAAGNLLAASDYARTAFAASEHAFFDASLLAQLYFPDEQKYAIYIPLFLPIMVPVITSFTMIRKLLTKLRNAENRLI